MAKAMGQYEKVLNVLLEAQGNAVPLETFREKCEVAGINMYRISTYMWEIKTKTQYGVIPTKDGRKVTGLQTSRSRQSSSVGFLSPFYLRCSLAHPVTLITQGIAGVRFFLFSA